MKSNKDGELILSPKWEVYFRRVLDREKALLTKQEQVELAVEKLFLSIYYLEETNATYGLELITIAIKKCREYALHDHLEYLYKFKKIFENKI